MINNPNNSNSAQTAVPTQASAKTPIQQTTSSTPPPTAVTPPPIQTLQATPSQPRSFKDSLGDNFSDLKDKFFKYLKILVTIGLAIQSSLGIFSSTKFIMVEYPMLEEQLALNQITKAQVKDFTSQEIVTIFSTIISIFFTLRIATVQKPLAKKINTLLGVLLFLANASLKDFLNRIGYFEKLQQLIIQVADFIGNLL